ncbi:hypothetical protein Tco_1494098 [Tanacetum coccineum]
MNKTLGVKISTVVSGAEDKKEDRVLRLANGKTWNAILNNTFGAKICTDTTCAQQNKGKRKIWRRSERVKIKRVKLGDPQVSSKRVPDKVEMSIEQREFVSKIGFSSLLKLKVFIIPSRLASKAVDSFDDVDMSLKLNTGDIKIQRETNWNSKKLGDVNVSFKDTTVTNKVAEKEYGKRSCLDGTIDHDFDELNRDIDHVAELPVEHFLQDNFVESYSS